MMTALRTDAHRDVRITSGNSWETNADSAMTVRAMDAEVATTCGGQASAWCKPRAVQADSAASHGGSDSHGGQESRPRAGERA